MKFIRHRFAFAVAAAFLAFSGKGDGAISGFTIDRMSVSPFADTEVSTNMPINNIDIGYVTLKFRFDGTPTNNLELAFGTDLNTNGVLEIEETEARFGWRGRYFMENVRTWERFEGETVVTPRSFSVEMRFEMDAKHGCGRVCRMAVTGMNAAPFGALLHDVPPEWVWRRKWDLMRATRRGTEPPTDWIECKSGCHGFSIRLK